MAFERPSLQELRDRIVSDLETRLEVAGAGLRNSFTKMLGYVLAGAAHLMHGHLEYISRQIFATTADGENLDRIGNQYGIERIAATYAEGSVTFTGDDGTEIPTDTELTSSDGVLFRTTEAGTVGEVSSGLVEVPVVASSAGENGNVEVGAMLTLSSPIAGVESEAEVTEEITGGGDQEEDEDYRERILERLQEPPLGGALQDYVAWAKEIPGVTRAWAYEMYYGEGTVATFFLRDDDEDSIFPSEEEIEDVSAHIEENRPVAVHSYVFSPTGIDIDFEIELDPDTDEVKEAVELELQDLIDREAEPGGTILLSHIREAISLAAGENDHTLVQPTADFEVSDGYIAQFGEITWS